MTVADSGPGATPSLVAFAVDCDRTITGADLVPDPEALFAIRDLRNAGIRCVLVTGRSKEDLQRFPLVGQAFDAYTLEGGAVWGSWNLLLRPNNANVVLDAADRVAKAGIAVERRTTSFSVALADLAAVRDLAGDCSLQVNLDRVDVLPPGLDKGVGLDGALGSIGIRGARVVAIGDAENDLAMFERADVGLAVSNAVPLLKANADEVLDLPGPAAVVHAVRRLLQGDWRGPGPVPPAAA